MTPAAKFCSLLNRQSWLLFITLIDHKCLTKVVTNRDENEFMVNTLNFSQNNIFLTGICAESEEINI